MVGFKITPERIKQEEKMLWQKYIMACKDGAIKPLSKEKWRDDKRREMHCQGIIVKGMFGEPL